MKILGILLLITSVNSFTLAMFYCGIVDGHCVQSKTDDVYPGSTFVILAFVNVSANGSASVTPAHFPDITPWTTTGKKVLISVGGEYGNWDYVFQSPEHSQLFVTSLTDIVQNYSLDGVDLDIQSDRVTPGQIAGLIKTLKLSLLTLGPKLLTVSPGCLGVYQGAIVPPVNSSGYAFNNYVPVINLADQYIDYYQPQAYGNWYDDITRGSVEYLMDVYLNWRNLQGLNKAHTIIPNFAGVKGEKLAMGLPASTSAATAIYYFTPEIIAKFQAWLKANNYPLKGFMIWDSNWDIKNNFTISKAATEASNLEAKAIPAQINLTANILTN